MKFIEKIRHFMYGRNGMDALNSALFWLYFILWIVNNLFVRSQILYSVSMIAAVYTLFRCFSRNLPARRKENLWYWNLKTKLESKARNVAFFRTLGASFAKLKTRLVNIVFKSRRYRTCPACKAELCLPLPRRRGKHTVKCPRCNRNFDVHILL